MNLPLESRIRAANSELMANGNLDAVGEFFAADYVAHLTEQEMTGGHDAIRRVIGMYRHSFPDLRVEVEVLVESGDRIAWLRTLRGTHENSFKGFPGSGHPIVWREMLTSQFRDGLIVQEWVSTDLAERLLLSRKR